MDGGGVEGSCDGASPLQSESGSDFLFGGKAKFFDPFADFSIADAALGFEGGADFGEGKLAAGDHEEPEGNAVGGLRRWSHHAQVGELADEGDLQALGLAIEGALEEGSLAVAEALPERSRARAGDERARGLRRLPPATTVYHTSESTAGRGWDEISKAADFPEAVPET